MGGEDIVWEGKDFWLGILNLKSGKHFKSS